MQIELVPYEPEWPKAYEREAARIASALGSVALAIEHVGSTAVPGLIAKPVIDIHLAVADSADEGAYAARLEALGYRLIHREPDWFEHRMFRLWEPAVNLHVFSAGCLELARCRLFRDWLRCNEADRELYARTKLELATRSWERVQDYADAKSDIVVTIMARAKGSASSPSGSSL